MKTASFIKAFTAMILLFTGGYISAQTTTIQIGEGTSSSSTRGPFQRADTASSTVFSRWIQIFTAEELSTAGMIDGSSIVALNWELASSNVIIGDGDANLKIYIKNSDSQAAIVDTWPDQTAASTLVYENDFNTENNFPGANGWMPFAFDTPFQYTGGAVEIAVDWDCSQVSTPAFSGDGALKWRWASTAPNFLVSKKTSSSAPSTTEMDLKDERANIQIEFSTEAICTPPASVFATSTSATSADLSWSENADAIAYNWLIVAAGDGSDGVAVDAGSSAMTSASTSLLAELTSYDLYVQTECGVDDFSGFAGPYTFATPGANPEVITIGLETSSSSSRGPFQRSDTLSSTVFSRFFHVYTEAELAASGLEAGNLITSLNWDLASENVMIGDGNANLKIYIKNSASTEAAADDWVNLINGASLVADNDYNVDNNFPGEQGWMGFDFSAPFEYTGGAIEVSVDWDCSQVSTPAFSGDGSLKWRWSPTTPDLLVAKRTSSSSSPTSIEDLSDERANIQFVYSTVTCDPAVNFMASDVQETSATISWEGTADTFNWILVNEGAGVEAEAIAFGSTSESTTTVTELVSGSSYDFYVQSDCGDGEISDYAGPYNFSTLCGDDVPTAITSAVTNALCNGEENGAIDITVTAGIEPLQFSWSNSSDAEDISEVPAGSYTLTVTDGNGCPFITELAVSEPDALELTATSTSDIENGAVGTASVEITGGTEPYVITWDGEVGTTELTGLTMGTYEVEVTDDNGCVASVSVEVDNDVSINQITSVSSLTISPNPSAGLSTIQLELNENSDVVVTVLTITGKIVEEFVNEDVMAITHNINLANYSDGLYFVRLAVNEEVITKKITLLK